MQNTEQQDEFLLHLTASEANLALIANAGCGKTSTLYLAAVALPQKQFLYSAFSKRNVTEAEGKFPSNVVCTTTNALGHRAWGGQIRRRLNLIKDKKWKLAKDSNINTRRYPDAVSLFDKARVAGLVPHGAIGAPRGFLPDDEESWLSIAERFSLDVDKKEIELARKLLLSSISLAWNGVIDYEDQNYMPAFWGGSFPAFDILLLDEAQDLSPTQHRLLERASRSRRIILVGDPNQAIYAFRGADSNSLDNLIIKFSCTTLPLSVSFRCPKAVIAEAQLIVPHITCHDSAPAGSVIRHDKWEVSLFSMGDTIICRNNAPLVPVFYALIKAGVGAKILGRDIGAGLIRILDKFNPVSPISKQIDEWERFESEQARSKDRSSEHIRDKAEVLRLIVERVGPSIPTIAAEIKRIFTFDERERPPITLSSIHKAKGLEWNRVFFLDDNLIPSPYANQDWEKQQENNLRYVGITRAKVELHYIYSEGRQNA